MILPLALTLSLFPQGPAASGLGAHLESLDLREHTEDLAGRIARGGKFRRGIRSPEFLRKLRANAQPLVDPALDLVSPYGDAGLGLEPAMDLLERIMGAGRRRAVPQGPMDPRRFRSLLIEVHRDLRRSLGREGEPHEQRSRLQIALERLRGASVEERNFPPGELKHLDTVDLLEIQRLSRIVVGAAMALGHPDVLEQLRNKPTRSVYEDVVGEVLWDWDTPFGRFVVGGFGPNIYDCTQIDVIVDLGGEDLYRGPAGATKELDSLGVVVDIEGNDRYEALNDGLGSATYGLGILLDMAGDDAYSARARSAGFGLAGVGMLVDLQGDDTLELDHHGGGVGMAGVGFLLDLDGHDEQRAASESFALGMPGGVGLFLDASGNDIRELGATALGDLHGNVDLSLGFGAGLGTHDRLEAGMGLFLDAQGDDDYRAGSFSLGAGAQGGLGMFFDLSGDDTYQAGSVSQGVAYDFGKSLFFEGAGKDEHTVDGGFGMGAASRAGEAWFVDVSGDDMYRLAGMGFGEARTPGLAGFLDLSGADRYLKEKGQTPWPARGDRPGIEGALSLFVDEGSGRNGYAWSGDPVPERGELVRREIADGRQLALIVLVDR